MPANERHDELVSALSNQAELTLDTANRIIAKLLRDKSEQRRKIHTLQARVTALEALLELPVCGSCGRHRAPFAKHQDMAICEPCWELKISAYPED